VKVRFLKQPAYANGDWLHLGDGRCLRLGSSLAAAVEAVFSSATVSDALQLTGPPASHVVGEINLPIAESYDVVILEQGYGGVFVHAAQLARTLRRHYRVLMLVPGDPFFGIARHSDDLTVPRLREAGRCGGAVCSRCGNAAEWDRGSVRAGGCGRVDGVARRGEHRGGGSRVVRDRCLDFLRAPLND
jgi:hypothetical protein